MGEFSSEEEEERDESEEFEDEIVEPIAQADEMDVEEVLNEIGEDFDQSDDFDKDDENNEDDKNVDVDEDDEEVDDDEEYDEEGDDDEYDEEGDDDEYDEEGYDDEFEDESEDTWKNVDEYKDEENQEELEQWDLEQEQYDFDKNAIETGAVGNIEKSIPLNDNTVADWWEEDNGGGLISIPGLFVFAVAVVGIVYFLKKRASPDTTIRIGYAPVPGAAKSHTR